MKNKSILIYIIFWCEMIAAARILVFTMPVLIKSYSEGSLSLSSIEGLSVMTLTLISLYYFMTGLASVLGLRAWRLFHYLGTILTMVLSFSLIKKVTEVNASAHFVYYIPLILSVLLSLLVGLSGAKAQRAVQRPV